MLSPPLFIFWSLLCVTCKAQKIDCDDDPEGDLTGVCAGYPCGDPSIGKCCINADKQTFRCICTFGFTGELCEVSDQCVSHPCMNGGSCEDGVAVFACTCPSYSTGPICEQVLDGCGSNPCRWDSACTWTCDATCKYVCSCPTWTKGVNCEIVTTENQTVELNRPYRGDPVIHLRDPKQPLPPPLSPDQEETDMALMVMGTVNMALIGLVIIGIAACLTYRKRKRSQQKTDAEAGQSIKPPAEGPSSASLASTDHSVKSVKETEADKKKKQPAEMKKEELEEMTKATARITQVTQKMTKEAEKKAKETEMIKETEINAKRGQKAEQDLKLKDKHVMEKSRAKEEEDGASIKQEQDKVSLKDKAERRGRKGQDAKTRDQDAAEKRGRKERLPESIETDQEMADISSEIHKRKQKKTSTKEQKPFMTGSIDKKPDPKRKLAEKVAAKVEDEKPHTKEKKKKRDKAKPESDKKAEKLDVKREKERKSSRYNEAADSEFTTSFDTLASDTTVTENLTKTKTSKKQGKNEVKQERKRKPSLQSTVNDTNVLKSFDTLASDVTETSTKTKSRKKGGKHDTKIDRRQNPSQYRTMNDNDSLKSFDTLPSDITETSTKTGSKKKGGKLEVKTERDRKPSHQREVTNTNIRTFNTLTTGMADNSRLTGPNLKGGLLQVERERDRKSSFHMDPIDRYQFRSIYALNQTAAQNSVKPDSKKKGGGRLEVTRDREHKSNHYRESIDDDDDDFRDLSPDLKGRHAKKSDTEGNKRKAADKKAAKQKGVSEDMNRNDFWGGHTHTKGLNVPIMSARIVPSLMSQDSIVSSTDSFQQ